MDENHPNVHVQVRVVDYGERNEDGEPLQVTHEQAFTRDRIRKQSPDEFAETVVGLGAEAVARRFRGHGERAGEPLSSFLPRLKFAHGPADLLVNEWTDTTIRYDPDDDHDYRPGDVLELVYAPTGDVFARAEVQASRSAEAKDALRTVDDLGGSYSTDTLNALIDILNDYYADPLDYETEVRVLVLDVLETTDEVDL